MPSIRLRHVSLLAVFFVSLATQNAIAQTAATEDMEKQLRNEVADAVMTNQLLHGTWADIRRIEEKGFEIDLVVDSQPEIERSQTQELSHVVKAIVKDVPFEVKVVDRLPFKQMLDKLRTDVELSVELAGAAVDDAYYSNDSSVDDVYVILVGRVLNNDQRDRMTSMSNLRINKMFVGSVKKIQATKTLPENSSLSGVVQVRPSSVVSNFCFGLGTQRFMCQQYEEAYVSFTQANLNAPERTDLQYWRVVSLIGSGRESDAKRLLTGIVKANRQASYLPRETDVYRSLERVQGPIRWRLMTMENSLSCKTCN